MYEYRQSLDRLLAERNHAICFVKEEKLALEIIKNKTSAIIEAQKIVQSVAEKVQQKAHEQIANVVSQCLKTVFGEEAYQFKINFEQKRGKTEAKLMFIRGELEIDEPTEGAGLGQVDVAAFALRLTKIMLARPKRRHLIVCDEPFKYVSAEYIENVKELLLTVAKELGFQIILVTHNKELMVGNVVEL